MELCGEKIRVVHTALQAGAEDTAKVDISMPRIRATLTEEGATAAKQLFHVLVMNMKGWQ